METHFFLYYLLILKIFIPECAGSPLNEPLSAHNDSMLGRDINGKAENTQINIHTIGNLTSELFRYNEHFCDETDDNVKKIVQLEDKIDKVMGITKKVQESNLENGVLLKNKIDELMGEIKEQQTNMEKVLKMLSCEKSPAFTGSSYLAIAVPKYFTNFSMSMEVKAAAPVTDGIIMYCAEKVEPGYGGFMSLAVRQGRLEFKFYLGWYRGPLIVLTADKTLPANEWTNIEVSRVGSVVSLRINSGAALEGRLTRTGVLAPDTPLFIGGVDGSTVLHSDTAVSGGFKGCIKGAQGQMQDTRIYNIEAAASKSLNVQKCC